MLTLPATLKVFLHLTPVDLRNGFDGFMMTSAVR